MSGQRRRRKVQEKEEKKVLEKEKKKEKEKEAPGWRWCRSIPRTRGRLRNTPRQ